MGEWRLFVVKTRSGWARIYAPSMFAARVTLEATVRAVVR